MRILGFSRKDWMNYITGKPKLEEDNFTTFRFTRKDKDWSVEEVVQVVIKPRRKGGGEKLGIAEIIKKEPRWVNGLRFVLHVNTHIETVNVGEARADGFASSTEMIMYMRKAYGDRILAEPFNKLTLRWVNE